MSRNRMRSRQLATLLALFAIIVTSIYLLRPTSSPHPIRKAPQEQPAAPPGEQHPEKPAPAPDHHNQAPPDLTAPKTSDEKLPAKETAPQKSQPPIDDLSHPIDSLISEAGHQHKETVQTQSATLEEAVAEYKKRYNMLPPPNFDKWYSLAVRKGVQLIDEYDSIYDSLLPFWGLPPATIRTRAKESLGCDNGLMGVSIRNGKIVHIARAKEWQQKATSGMMKEYVKFLPDMDLAFNIHDEPRVLLAHDDLNRLVKKATDVALPAALQNKNPRNSWSKRPDDLNDGTSFPETRFTRFNAFAHQPTWSHSRQSCSPDSAARSLDEVPVDNTEPWSISDVNFIRNKTAFSDICNSPSLRETFGFFDRPNAMIIVQDLFPVFSQSKISSFQDILYPSPWYWVDKVPYKKSQDRGWGDKLSSLYWRGTTTGGFSRDGGWRRQHRQRIVKYVNGKDNTYVLNAANSPKGTTEWHAAEVPKTGYSDLMDVRFSGVGQCDAGDCDAQREFFEIAESAKFERAWDFKYLLDLDGNAFSGRFYAFLRSRSMVFKMAVFREWHDEWIKPWVHYVPLSLGATEYFETVRYFDREPKGKMQALEIAESGRNWASLALRNEDLEIWFFRLLLEYGRVVDDERELIGFSM